MIKFGVMAGLLAGVAMIQLPTAASAQTVRDLDTETSTMRSFSGRVTEGSEDFEVAIPAGMAMRIDAITTSELDPVLTVTDVATGEVLAEDDDSGGDLNSRVVVRGDDAGRRVRLSVSAFSWEGMEEPATGGTFTLQLTSVTINPQGTRQLAWGGSTSGTLSADETHEYTFTGEPRTVLEVNMMFDGEFSELDPYLELQNEFGEVLAFNDDSGDTLNSRVRFVLPDAGTYRIIASTFGDSSGDYTLTVADRREAIDQNVLQTIGLAQEAEGMIGLGIEAGSFDPAYIDYQLSDAAISAIRRGEGGVTIRMTAATDSGEYGFDPYVELGFDTPLGFAVVASDDDGAGDLNSLLPIDLSQVADDAALMSRLRIRAQGFGGSEGGYILQITEGLEERVVLDDYIEDAEPLEY